MLLAGLAAIAENNNYDTLNPPNWSEFCPYEYQHARIFSASEIESLAQESGAESSNIFYCKYHGKTAKIIRGITIIPAIDCYLLNKMNVSNWRKSYNMANVENAYWYNRRMAFENALESCKNLSNDSKVMCYLKIREIELQKNAYRQQESYNQEIVKLQRQQNYNNIYNNWQINNNLQNVNNNLRNINNSLRY